MSLLERRLRDVPLAVVDFETTGLSARGGARIVEVAVARVDPGREPQLVLDTLVDPQGPVLCSSIHGIYDDDVVGAPLFGQALVALLAAMDGALVAAFNASFDMSFLSAEAEMANRGKALRLPPYVCLMWLRPLIGISKRCSLEKACEQHGLQAGTHRAAEDALACAYMWRYYVDAAEGTGIQTFGQLAKKGTHKYLKTLSSTPYGQADCDALSFGGVKLKPRSSPVASPVVAAGTKVVVPAVNDRQVRVRRYWHALVDALSDNQFTADEAASLLAEQQTLALSAAEVRSVHARVFADRLRVYAEDDAVSDAEASVIGKIRQVLAHLGWSP